jgi:hypothetical protein
MGLLLPNFLLLNYSHLNLKNVPAIALNLAIISIINVKLLFIRFLLSFDSSDKKEEVKINAFPSALNLTSLRSPEITVIMINFLDSNVLSNESDCQFLDYLSQNSINNLVFLFYLTHSK